ncbi:MAG: MotA/TolQ/ExbB proton channel family protein [Bacteroidales bacterium]|nr:MotA/TolQ/ExbB proton channel family protein [Bacteroidales bacterium]MBQ3812083.1 MotA/TolQ/ExbB proton channel family protein [Bacteroidales bacterium]
MKEEIVYVVDSLGVAHPETIERARVTLPQLFVEGGLGWMIGISLFLIALLLAAWKAPRWVREIGIGALIFAIYGTLLGILQVLDALQSFGDVGLAVICGGLKVTLIPTFYGLIVYFISLIIRVIQKPRI